MKGRSLDPKLKAKIVLEDLKGRPIGEICNEYQICQSQYYQWRDQFLSNKEYESIGEVEKGIQEWIRYCNTSYLHSLLGYKPPVQIEKEYKGKAA